MTVSFMMKYLINFRAYFGFVRFLVYYEGLLTKFTFLKLDRKYEILVGKFEGKA